MSEMLMASEGNLMRVIKDEVARLIAKGHNPEFAWSDAVPVAIRALYDEIHDMKAKLNRWKWEKIQGSAAEWSQSPTVRLVEGGILLHYKGHAFHIPDPPKPKMVEKVVDVWVIIHKDGMVDSALFEDFPSDKEIKDSYPSAVLHIRQKIKYEVEE
jgi:hypothetical protein